MTNFFLIKNNIIQKNEPINNLFLTINSFTRCCRSSSSSHNGDDGDDNEKGEYIFNEPKECNVIKKKEDIVNVNVNEKNIVYGDSDIKMKLKFLSECYILESNRICVSKTLSDLRLLLYMRREDEIDVDDSLIIKEYFNNYDKNDSINIKDNLLSEALKNYDEKHYSTISSSPPPSLCGGGGGGGTYKNDNSSYDIGSCVLWKSEKKIKKGKNKDSCTLIFSYNKQKFNARRIALKLFKNVDLNKNAIIKTKCDNIYCIRPSHMKYSFDNRTTSSINVVGVKNDSTIIDNKPINIHHHHQQHNINKKRKLLIYEQHLSLHSPNNHQQTINDKAVVNKKPKII